MDPPVIPLAGLAIHALSRPREGHDGDYDADWIACEAKLQAPGALIEATGTWLRAAELVDFKARLAGLHRDLAGTARLACLENTLEVEVTVDRLGHVRVTVEISPDPATQSHRVIFDIDQSFLPATLAGCRRVLDRFPPVRSAGAGRRPG